MGIVPNELAVPDFGRIGSILGHMVLPLRPNVEKVSWRFQTVEKSVLHWSQGAAAVWSRCPATVPCNLTFYFASILNSV